MLAGAAATARRDDGRCVCSAGNNPARCGLRSSPLRRRRAGKQALALRDVLPPGVAQLLFVERTSREGCVGLASIAVRVALTLRRSNGAARALKRNCGAR